METIWAEFFTSFLIFLLYLIPMYISNATPIMIHGKTPLDFNATLFKKRLLGKGKTVIGTLAGIVAGILFSAITLLVFPHALSLIPDYFLIAVLISIGAVAGDIIKSFFKRRVGIESGEKWELADQWDFVLGGLILSAVIRPPELWLAASLLISTFFIHKAMNYFAFKIKLKKVPW